MAALLSEVQNNHRVAAAPTSLPVPGEVYRHYKGALYRVEAVATVEATLEPAVLYRAATAQVGETLWMRTLSQWVEPASTPAGPVERFALAKRA